MKPSSPTTSPQPADPPRIARVMPQGQSRPFDYARDQAGALRRWFARTFNVENVVAFLKTAAWVVPLTILIWVYAEREQVAKKPDVTVPIAVKSTDPNRIVQLRIAGHAIMTELVGPRAQVDRVYDLVTRPGDEPAVQIEIDTRKYAPGKPHTFETARLVGDNPIFRARGVLLADCKPANIEIEVDDVIEREVEVKLPDKMPPSVSASFEPRTVKVRGPKTVLSAEPLRVWADVAGRQELQTQGQHELGSVPLVCSIDNPAIRIDPGSVRMSIDVAQIDERFTINSMPVWPSHPGPLLDDYKVEFTQNITKITVSGPPDKIALLRDSRFLPKAILEVSDEDRDKSGQRYLKFSLPEGVSVVPEDVAKTNWQFKVTKRTPD